MKKEAYMFDYNLTDSQLFISVLSFLTIGIALGELGGILKGHHHHFRLYSNSAGIVGAGLGWLGALFLPVSEESRFLTMLVFPFYVCVLFLIVYFLSVSYTLLKQDDEISELKEKMADRKNTPAA
jgi:hypothetical protein